jgi:hypothetical protein
VSSPSHGSGASSVQCRTRAQISFPSVDENARVCATPDTLSPQISAWATMISGRFCTGSSARTSATVSRGRQRTVRAWSRWVVRSSLVSIAMRVVGAPPPHATAAATYAPAPRYHRDASDMESSRPLARDHTPPATGARHSHCAARRRWCRSGCDGSALSEAGHGVWQQGSGGGSNAHSSSLRSLGYTWGTMHEMPSCRV